MCTLEGTCQHMCTLQVCRVRTLILIFFLLIVFLLIVSPCEFVILNSSSWYWNDALQIALVFTSCASHTKSHQSLLNPKCCSVTSVRVSVITKCVVTKLIERNPPPGGGFLFTMFPHQEPCVRGPPSKDLYQVLRGGSSYTRFLMREHSK